MAAQVTIREHKISSVDEYGLEVESSLNQDFVFVNGKLAGYLTWTDKCFKPIVGWNNAHNETVCKALEELKGEDFGPISHVETLSVSDIQQQSEDE